MAESEDSIYPNLKPEVPPAVIPNPEVPDYGDLIIIKNPNKYYLYCEGGDEYDYFDSLRKAHLRSSKIKVLLYQPKRENNDGKDAKSLVNQLIKAREDIIQDNNFLEGDSFFLIFDRDNNCDEPPGKREKHLDYCLKKCGTYSFKPIFSNPCFDVWLICQYEKPEKKGFPFKSSDTKSLRKKIVRRPSNQSLKEKRKLENAKNNAEEIYNERKREGTEIHSRNSYPVTEVFQLIKLLERELGIR